MNDDDRVIATAKARVDAALDQNRAKLSEWADLSNFAEVQLLRTCIQSDEAMAMLPQRLLTVVRQLAHSGLMLALQSNIDKTDMEMS